jgi:hypothetical protein
MRFMIDGMRAARQSAALAAVVMLAACQVVPPAAPQPAAPPPQPAPPPAPAPVAPTLTWDVAPVAQGNWTYQQSGGRTVARFANGATQPVLSMTCDPASKIIAVARSGAVSAATTMTIRTTAATLAWPAVPGSDAARQPAMVASRPASDNGFDSMAFSRGRFSIEVGGMSRLIVPAWAEVARVIEDCRG